MRLAKRLTSGSARTVVFAVLAAVVLVAAMIRRAMRDGLTDLGLIVALAVAALVAVVMVAPRYFTEDGDRPPWERKRPSKNDTPSPSPDNERHDGPPAA